MTRRRKQSSFLWSVVTAPFKVGKVVLEATALTGLVSGAVIYHGIKAVQRSVHQRKLLEEQAKLYAQLSEADKIKFDLAEVKRRLENS